LRCRTATCHLNAAFSASSRRFGFNGNTNSLTRKMSSAIIVASRYVIPSLEQTDEFFGTQVLTRCAPAQGQSLRINRQRNICDLVRAHKTIDHRACPGRREHPNEFEGVPSEI
jgi:hypothetical protein